MLVEVSNTYTLANRKEDRTDMTKEQLGRLIIASEDTMYHVAKTLLRNDADCSDAIQEAVVKAFTKINTLRKDALGKTWLIRILINECYAIMRKEKRLVSLDSLSMEGKWEVTKDYSDLYEALTRLPEEDRLCVTLFYMEGYSIKEIASILKISESGVKSRLYRARNKLRQELQCN